MGFSRLARTGAIREPERHRMREGVDTLSTVAVPTRVGFADGATAASGVAEWKSFSHNASAVPEPSAWAIMLGSVGMFVGGRRFGRKNKA